MIIVFDTETTNLTSVEGNDLKNQPYIVELFAQKCDPVSIDVISTYHMIIKPPIPIPQEAINIHHIDNEMVKDKPKFAAYFKTLSQFFLGATHVVGHNVMFDKMVLYYELLRINKHLNFPWPPGAVCTVEAAVKWKGHAMNLTNLYGELYNETFAGAHRAENDVDVTRLCLKKMIELGYVTM